MQRQRCTAALRTRIAVRRLVPTEDPLLEFTSERAALPGNQLLLPTGWPVSRPPSHAIDTTSRVISFVLGFALASFIAWLGSIDGDEIATAPPTVAVASTVKPVVVADTPIAKAPPTASAKATVAPAPPAKPASAPAPAPAPTPAPRPAARTAAPASLAAAAAPTRPARQPLSGYRGGLTLSSVPEGAQVVLNGTVVGQTPVVLNDLPVGSRVLLVRRDGYSPWSASVRIVANQRTTVRATLTPAPRTGG